MISASAFPAVVTVPVHDRPSRSAEKELPAPLGHGGQAEGTGAVQSPTLGDHWSSGGRKNADVDQLGYSPRAQVHRHVQAAGGLESDLQSRHVLPAGHRDVLLSGGIALGADPQSIAARRDVREEEMAVPFGAPRKEELRALRSSEVTEED